VQRRGLALVLSKTEGASKHFTGGVITYTKETRLLGVPPELIQRCTVVCAEVAEAMAQGVIARSKADLGVSITGVAGPEPDEDGNPVGLVYCAVARAGMIKHFKLRCKSKNPDEIIDEACVVKASSLVLFEFGQHGYTARPEATPWRFSLQAVLESTTSKKWSGSRVA
jgi:nicotinamide-nucleotide amidase